MRVTIYTTDFKTVFTIERPEDVIDYRDISKDYGLKEFYCVYQRDINGEVQDIGYIKNGVSLLRDCLGSFYKCKQPVNYGSNEAMIGCSEEEFLEGIRILSFDRDVKDLLNVSEE